MIDFEWRTLCDPPYIANKFELQGDETFINQ